MNHELTAQQRELLGLLWKDDDAGLTRGEQAALAAALSLVAELEAELARMRDELDRYREALVAIRGRAELLDAALTAEAEGGAAP